MRSEHTSNGRPEEPERRAHLGASASATLDLASRLPEFPFREHEGELRIAHWDYLFSFELVPVLGGLMADSGDDFATVLVLDPLSPNDVAAGLPTAIRLLSQGLSEETYWAAVTTEPERGAGSPTDTAKVVSIVGERGTWAIWAEWEWELLLIWSAKPAGAWAPECAMRFYTPEEALRECTFAYTSPETVDLNSPSVATFLERARHYRFA